MITRTEATGRTVMVAADASSALAVLPLHHGHHPVWSSSLYQADICNMVDDLVVRDWLTGYTYRFPVTKTLLPWLGTLIGKMNSYDQESENPWWSRNAVVRDLIMNAVLRRLEDGHPDLNIFEPGYVGPALVLKVPAEADDMLTDMICDRPHCIVL